MIQQAIMVVSISKRGKYHYAVQCRHLGSNKCRVYADCDESERQTGYSPCICD